MREGVLEVREEGRRKPGEKHSGAEFVGGVGGRSRPVSQAPGVEGQERLRRTRDYHQPPAEITKCLGIP